MFTLVYKSKAAQDLDATRIKSLFIDAQIRNKKQGITGCLLHHQDKFVQLLEGDKDVIKALFMKIKEDTRHQEVIVLNTEKSPLRIFGEWHMIYSKIEDGNSKDEIKKRRLFDQIFHSSNAVFLPGNSKLTLWLQVNKLLNKDISRVA